MVQIAGTYQHVKNENFLEHLLGYDIPEDRAQAIDALKPELQVVSDGKKITIHIDSGDEKTSTTFVLDEEVDEHLPNNFNLKSIARLDGDTLTISSKSPSTSPAVRIYKFSNTQLIVTSTSENPKVPTAKRYYKRV